MKPDARGTLFILLLLCLCLASAGWAGGAPTGAELLNGTYDGFSVTSEPVTLTNGRWQGAPFVKDAASRPEITLLTGSFPIADFNGDGMEEAAVLLTESGGTTGTFYYLAVAAKKDGTLNTLATKMLGDRLQIIEFGADKSGAIVVTAVQGGPDDPSCCPGELVTRRFYLEGNTLREDSSDTEAARLSPAAMAGGTWILTSWNSSAAAPADPEITLVYKDGKFTGSSGCNNYFTEVTAGETAGSITVGVTGGTRMMCAPPVDAAEMRFLTLLAGVTGFAFDNSRLLLSYSADGEDGTMVFSRRPDETIQ